MLLARQPPNDVAAFRGPAYGLMAINLMPGLIAFLVFQSLVPVLKNGTDIWLASILPVIGASGLLIIVFMAGLLGRSSWYSPIAQAFGWMVMVAYGLGLVLGLALVAGWMSRTDSGLGFVNVVNIVLWVAFSPSCILLWKFTHVEAWRRLPQKS